LVNPGEKKEPLKIYADNKESYFQASYITIMNTDADTDESHNLGDVILLKNITEFKELDTAKTTFISTISHELKTPISAILMSLQLLEDNRVGALNEEQEQLSKSIRENADRLLGITGELLNMTQVEAGKLQMIPKITKPIELIEYAIKANQVQADKFNIQIEVEYPEETEETEPEIEDLDATRVIPDVTKQDAWHATPGDTQEFNLEEELKAALSGMDGLREQEEAERSASLDPEPETASEEEIAFEEKTEPMTEENTTEESVVEEGSETEAEEPEGDHIDKMLEEAEIQPDISEMTLERETPEEKRQRILNNTRPERLTAEQKQLFSYFAKVPGMDDQILDAIHGAYEYASEKTSHRGNIAIMGSHGTGKTRLSEGLVKAICKELGLKAVKYANLDASDINRKDPATIISKMAGGFLLIERASFMTPETIEKLSQAMDFRTDSMILLIEDDKANMRKMLADYPEFAEKFETVISIPVFTNDELVTFARTYARENGFRMDEMGVLALYTMIGDNQKEDEPITIGKVKEMVDGAIRKASGVKLGRKLSKRHTDADGRILLYEKDFDL